MTGIITAGMTDDTDLASNITLPKSIPNEDPENAIKQEIK